MNLTCYATGSLELPIGTKVTLITPSLDKGRVGEGFGNLETLATLASTIPYEILTRLHPSIRRRIVE
jgi:alanine racemase